MLPFSFIARSPDPGTWPHIRSRPLGTELGERQRAGTAVLGSVFPMDEEASGHGGAAESG